MENVDWVTELFSNCSPNSVFEMLKEQVRNDVKIRNGLRSQYAAYTYSVQNSGESFKVIIEREGDHRSVRFELVDRTITVTDEHDKELFKATLALNDNGKCRPKIGDRLCEWWQLREMALENLFTVS